MIRVIFNFLKYMKQHSFCFFAKHQNHVSEGHLSQKEVDEVVSFINFKNPYLGINYHSYHSHFHFLVIFPQRIILHFITKYVDCSVLGI